MRYLRFEAAPINFILMALRSIVPASLRPATDEDVAQILKIENQSYPTPWTKDQFSGEIVRPFAGVLVMTDDETDEMILGYIVYWIQVEGVSLLNVAVHPEWRGLGLGERLVRAMINETVRDEIPKIHLEVRVSNIAAIKLYESIGFKKTHERKNFYSNGETAYAMELTTSDLPGMIQ